MWDHLNLGCKTPEAFSRVCGGIPVSQLHDGSGHILDQRRLLSSLINLLCTNLLVTHALINFLCTNLLVTHVNLLLSQLKHHHLVATSVGV